MKTRNPIVRAVGGAMALAMLALSAPGAARGQSDVRRGTPEQQGKVWMERDECGSPVKAGARLVVRAAAGSIRVDTGVKELMRCEVLLRAYTGDEAQARRLFKAFNLSVRPLPDGGVLVSGTSPGAGHKSFSAEYRVTAPARFNLDLETGSGNIVVANSLEGEIRATTAGGDVQISGASGPVKVETAGGNVTLGNIGSAVEARTAGGRIRVGNVKGDTSLETSGGDIVMGRIEGKVRAETAGGDVVLRGADGAVQAVTSGGQIQIGEAGGSVRAETAGGSVRIQGARGLVRVESAGGSIDLYQLQGPVEAVTARGSIVAQIDASRKAFSASSLATSTGDIQVYLPQSLPLTIEAAIQNAAGHRIISDFPLEIQGGNENLLRTTLRGRGVLNGGGELLKIHCAGGNIEIHKLDEQALERLRTQQADYWKRWQESQK